jgi:hypothetical protein
METDKTRIVLDALNATLTGQVRKLGDIKTALENMKKDKT